MTATETGFISRKDGSSRSESTLVHVRTSRSVFFPPLNVRSVNVVEQQTTHSHYISLYKLLDFKSNLRIPDAPPNCPKISSGSSRGTRRSKIYTITMPSADCPSDPHPPPDQPIDPGKYLRISLLGRRCRLTICGRSFR